MHSKLIKIHPKDNVAIALVNLPKGELTTLEDEDVLILTDTKAKHKIALEPLHVGGAIFMYGVLIGKAVTEIKKGELLTTENIKHQTQAVIQKTEITSWNPPDLSHWKNRTFMGYHRPDGQVGTQNIWLFFPLVFCENRNIEVLKDVFEKELSTNSVSSQRLLLRQLVNGTPADTIAAKPVEKSPAFDNIQVKFITHQGGCGGVRQDSESLARLLAGYVNNPNVAGATVLSLGCQNLQIDIFKTALNRLNSKLQKPVLIYEQQQMGTVDNLLNQIIKDSFAGIRKANEILREPAPLSKLKMGLECGGSDGFSGISANPSLGYASDILAALGGSPILSEFPELCGVEQELVNRCATNADAERFISLMKAYEAAVEAAGSGFDMNPSPGNIKDGLITDAMKSAGAAKKEVLPQLLLFWTMVSMLQKVD